MLKNYKADKPLKILFMRSGGYFMEIEPPDAPMIGLPKSILYLSGLFKDDDLVQTDFLDILVNADLKKVRTERKNPPIYFGMEDSEIIDYVENYSPHVLAVTSTANYYISDTIKLINLVKKNFPDIFIIVGGPDATNDYRDYFNRTSAIDVIVMKEGEVTFKELIDKLRSNKPYKEIMGIAYKENENITITEDRPYIENLDELYCDYDLVDLEKYFEINREGFPSRLIAKYKDSHRSIDLVTSRGCNFKCSHCCIHLHMGRKVRAQSVDYVLEEMKFLIEKHGVRNIHFEDDNLLFNPERFKNILRGIIKNEWNITWDTPNGVRADLVDEELVKLCKKTGCTYLIFGVESGSKKVLENVIKKDLNIEDVIKACKLCYENEIDTLTFFIFGMPGETKEDLLKTYYFAFDLFKKYNATPIFQIWRPYKNTDLEHNVRNSSNITRPVIFSLYEEYRIPYTLFYSKIYEDSEVTINFLSYYFEKYLKDSAKLAFINWLKITRRKPVLLLSSFFQVLMIFVKASFSPEKTRSKIQQFMISPGILPFSQLNKLGKNRK
ncbi:MAG: radical SAM protein [Desulfobacterales bacterium]|nr:radical SAM protein [Desulfobacterales bacterium]